MFRLRLFLLAVISIAVMSCSDEIWGNGDIVDMREGIDVSLKVRIQMPDMHVMSRSDVNAEVENGVTGIWVAVFDYETGAVKRAVFIEGSRSEDIHLDHPVDIGAVKSGKCRIVAVANYNYAKAESMAHPELGEVSLKELLSQVNSWEDYKAIALVRTLGSVDNPQNAIPMSGVYYESPDSDPASWEDYSSDPSAFIPASQNGGSVVSMPGAIHLRRVLSQVKFNIEAVDNVVSLEPYSWKVVNVPRKSWLAERNGKQAGACAKRNAGDEGISVEKASDNYGASYDFYSEDFHKTIRPDGSEFYQFDFWQLENKRRSVSELTDYNDRERYIKDENGRNLYFSALKDPDDPFNEYATYVMIYAHVTYKETVQIPGEDPLTGESNYVDATRTGDGCFMIHLGYIDGDLDDFECHRNTKYTYNVKVQTINNVVVEAETNEENQSSETGIVTDTFSEYVSLDAHYHAFNIRLTNAERYNSGHGLDFAIIAYDKNNAQVVVNPGKIKGDNPPEEKYWKWVELRPTTAENVLAVYKPHDGSNSDGATFYLTEAANLTAVNVPGGVTDPEDREERWYTVFVNEYVYEDDADETGDRWKEYVDLSDRKCWINVERQVSNDGLSVYYRSKYAFAQKSIQIFLRKDGVERCYGVEHSNETLGWNLRWNENRFSSWNSSYLSKVNGRWNQWKFIQSFFNGRDYRWDEVVNVTEPGFVPEIVHVQGEFGGYKTYVPEIQSGTYTGDPYNHEEQKRTDPFPEDASRTLDVLSACMNRNRDNNGNGVIDLDEVRWYLPATGRMNAIILGRRSLSSPIFRSPETTVLKASAGIVTPNSPKSSVSDRNTLYHFATSNGEVIWAEEGLSMSKWKNDWTWGAWSVRCIRNLGHDLNHMEQNELFTRAYYLEESGNIINTSNYDERSVRLEYRGIPYPPHCIYAAQNRVPLRFEFAQNDIRLKNPDGTNWNITNNDSWHQYLEAGNNPCAELGSDWRVPNQKELALMWNLGVLNSGGRMFVSCTHEFFNYYGEGSMTDYTNRRMLNLHDDHMAAFNEISEHYTTYVRCVRDVRDFKDVRH